VRKKGPFYEWVTLNSLVKSELWTVNGVERVRKETTGEQELCSQDMMIPRSKKGGERRQATHKLLKMHFFP